MGFKRQVISYNLGQNNTFYENEINEALRWLINVCDVQERGWAWVQFIRPNEQNTAEVISTLIEYIDFLTQKDIDLAVDAIGAWLLAPREHAVISIDYSWVLIALLKVYQCDRIVDSFDTEVLNDAILDCVDWLLANQYPSGGWADNPDEKATTIRTALALRALIETYGIYIQEDTRPELRLRMRTAIDIGINWLLDSQNSDGGWGSIREGDIDAAYQKKVRLSYADLRFQSTSNAACTGYALVALSYDTERDYRKPFNHAYKYLRDAQKENGGWDIFIEVGVRNDIKFTFRHFGTAWVLMGLIRSGLSDFSDECVMKGLYYLMQLQDTNYGGWKCSEDADNYTWATCNALDTIKMLRRQIAEVNARDFMKIVYDWWDIKKHQANFSLQVKDKVFAFNKNMGLLFCLIFSVMMLLVVMVFRNVIVDTGLEGYNIVNGATVIVAAVIMGIPWIVWVQNVFHKEMDNWINSIGWVYGIITGFVLVFYEYLT